MFRNVRKVSGLPVFWEEGSGGTEALFNQIPADKTPGERVSKEPEDNKNSLSSEYRGGEAGGRDG